MIDVIIFSRDRAAQLDLLLRSIQLNHNNTFSQITVLYTCTDDDFLAGYVLAQERHRKVDFITDDSEGNFQETLLTLLRSDSSEFITFFTDDDILYRPIPVDRKAVERQLTKDKDTCCVSLRLGQNTKIQDPYNHIATQFPKHVELDLPFVSWDWTQIPAHMNFGYPLSVDGHIFTRVLIEDLVSSIHFDNPNVLEGNLQNVKIFCPPFMTCFTHSVIVNSPTNRVQSVCPNRAGEVYGECAKTMNNSFVRGWYIDLDKTDFSDIVGCHQEIDFKWTDKN